MTKFYFHFHDNEKEVWVADPLELPDLQSARMEALASAKELVIEAIRSEQCVEGQRFVISDGAGAEVLTLSFVEAVKSVIQRSSS